jgi:hypothetical protein
MIGEVMNKKLHASLLILKLLLLHLCISLRFPQSATSAVSGMICLLQMLSGSWAWTMWYAWHRCLLLRVAAVKHVAAVAAVAVYIMLQLLLTLLQLQVQLQRPEKDGAWYSWMLPRDVPHAHLTYQLIQWTSWCCLTTRYLGKGNLDSNK